MDQDSIDKLARLVGSGQSRRRILKTLTGGTLGAVAAAIGLGSAAAAVQCRAQGVVCSKNADCCSAACLPKDRTGRRVCAQCGSVNDCPVGDQCRTAVCTGGSCGFSANVGVACNDGSVCTSGETCQGDGTCGGGTATVCTSLGECYVAGTCDPATGVCSNPTKQDGTVCVNSDACAPNSTCQAGICTGTAINCPEPDQCHTEGTCDHQTGICSNPAKANRTPCNPGEGPGICSDGVCIELCINGQACGEGGGCLDGLCYLTVPNCFGGVGVASNGNGLNVCICGGGSRSSCATTSDCPTDSEVCVLVTDGAGGFNGSCFGGCPLS